MWTSTDTPLRLSPPALSRTLVLGLGNPILRDDGVGWRVVEEVQEAWRRRIRGDELQNTFSVEFDCISRGGLALMERLVGYERAILVDAIQTRAGVPGAIYRVTLEDLPTLHADSAHDATLKAALALGRQLGAELPDEIRIIAIEAENVLDFGETLSPHVAASVGRATELVLAELGC